MIFELKFKIGCASILTALSVAIFGSPFKNKPILSFFIFFIIFFIVLVVLENLWDYFQKRRQAQDE